MPISFRDDVASLLTWLLFYLFLEKLLCELDEFFSNIYFYLIFFIFYSSFFNFYDNTASSRWLLVFFIDFSFITSFIYLITFFELLRAGYKSLLG